MDLGPYNSLGEYCGPHTASSVFLILLITNCSYLNFNNNIIAAKYIYLLDHEAESCLKIFILIKIAKRYSKVRMEIEEKNRFGGDVKFPFCDHKQTTKDDKRR